MSISKKIEEFLDKKRLTHTLAVRDLAVRLAEKYDVPQQKAETAALLHDITKCYPKEKQISLFRSLYPNIEVNYGIMHSFTSAYIAATKFGITDESVINAIKYHSTGNKNFDTLGYIIFISDYAEETRVFRKEAANVRKAAETNLKKAALLVSKDKMRFVLKKGELLDTTAVDFYNFLVRGGQTLDS